MTTASSLTAAGSNPDPDDLWAPASLFTATWAGQMSVVTNYRTAIQQAVSTAEQRFGRSHAPLREISCTVEGFTPEESGLLMAASHRFAKAKSLVPLYADQVETTANAAISATVLSISGGSHTRISTGGRVVVLGKGMNPDQQHISIVNSVGPSSITLATGLPSAFAAGARILPLMETQVRLTSSGSALTDSTSSLDIQATEVAGKSQLNILENDGDIPSGFSSYQSLPIFDGPVDWASPITWGVSRAGQISAAGISNEVTVYGTRAAIEFGFDLVHTTRESAFRTIRFFESRAGQLHPFFFVSPVTQFRFVSRSSTQVRVRVTAKDFLNDWTTRPYMALVAKDGTQQVRQIQSVTFDSNEAIVTTLTAFTIADAQVERATVAYKVRFASDELEENWSSTRAMRCGISVVEVLEEKTVEVEDLTALTSSNLSVRQEPGACSGESVSGCFNLCSDPLLTIRSPARLTVQIYAWGYGAADSTFFEPGYVGTDAKFDDTDICTGTKIAGTPYSFVYIYDEDTNSFVLSAADSDTPPCDYTLADLRQTIAFECVGFTNNDFYGMMKRVVLGGISNPPTEHGFAFSDGGAFTDLADISVSLDMQAFNSVLVRTGDLPLYRLTAEGISTASCSQIVVDDCFPLAQPDCGTISFMSRNTTASVLGETLSCNSDCSPDHFNSCCVEAVYDDIDDETTLWAGCLLQELTSGDLCDPAIEAASVKVLCCYIVVEGDATDGV